MNVKKLLLALSCMLCILSSCKKDEPNKDNDIAGTYSFQSVAMGEQSISQQNFQLMLDLMQVKDITAEQIFTSKLTLNSDNTFALAAGGSTFVDGTYAYDSQTGKVTFKPQSTAFELGEMSYSNGTLTSVPDPEAETALTMIYKK